jgi:uncharacterized MAPEG superfamily protein
MDKLVGILFCGAGFIFLALGLYLLSVHSRVLGIGAGCYVIYKILYHIGYYLIYGEEKEQR